jgi:hypothetical protein
VSLTYQIEVPEDGQYQLLLRAARAEGSATLTPRLNILDGDGQVLVSKYVMEPGETALTYVPYVFDLQLKAGRQTITLQKDNARACNLSLIRLEKAFSADDPDLKQATGLPRGSQVSAIQGTRPQASAGIRYYDLKGQQVRAPRKSGLYVVRTETGTKKIFTK